MALELTKPAIGTAKMAAMAAGTVELNILAWSQELTKYVIYWQPENATRRNES